MLTDALLQSGRLDDSVPGLQKVLFLVRPESICWALAPGGQPGLLYCC